MEDQWHLFRQYQEQQRQVQSSKEHQQAEEQRRKKQQTEEQYALRELERRNLEQRLIKERQRAEQQFAEQQRRQEEEHRAHLQRIAEELQAIDQQRQEAQRLTLLKLQAIQQSIKAGSPIENAFKEAWCEVYPSVILTPQYHIGPFRVDFAHPETKTVIELDGHKYHSTRRDRTKDAQRERWIQSQGWHVIRFTGTEVHADLVSCIQQVLDCILQRQGLARHGMAWYS